MNIIRAKEIISALAEGVDPVTGEILPEDHICNNAEVVRAFYTILQQENVEKKKKHMRMRAKNGLKKTMIY